MPRFRPVLRLVALCSLTTLLALGCADEEEECSDSDCVAPPASRCDGDALVTYAATGVCVGDDCRYEAFREPCEGTCEETSEASPEGEPVVTGASCVELPEGS